MAHRKSWLYSSEMEAKQEYQTNRAIPRPILYLVSRTIIRPGRLWAVGLDTAGYSLPSFFASLPTNTVILLSAVNLRLVAYQHFAVSLSLSLSSFAPSFGPSVMRGIVCPAGCNDVLVAGIDNHIRPFNFILHALGSPLPVWQASSTYERGLYACNTGGTVRESKTPETGNESGIPTRQRRGSKLP